MPSLFDITALTSGVRLDARRRGGASFTVFNASGRLVRGRAILVSAQPLARPWLTLDGETERDFGIASSQQYTVRIEAPPEAPPGSYTFRLDMVDTENPDENYSQGQDVTFEIPQIVDGGTRIPWWLIAAIAVGVLLIGGIIFGVARGCQARQSSAEATATAQARATQTALAGVATGTAQAQATQTANAAQATGTALAQATQTANAQATGTAAAQAAGTAAAQATATRQAQLTATAQAAARATATQQARLTATAQAFLRRTLNVEGDLMVEIRLPIIGSAEGRVPVRVALNLDANNPTTSFRDRFCVINTPSADVAMELALNTTLNPDGSIRVTGSLSTLGGRSCSTANTVGSAPIDLTVPAGGTQSFTADMNAGNISGRARLQFSNVQR